VLTLYAAMRGDLKVWAFEPAAVNYYNLVACELNGLERRVRCLRLGFSDTSGIMDLHVLQLMSARSFTFKESKKLDPKRESFPSIQAVQVCTIDEFIARYGAPCPNYIKSTCRASHRRSLPAQRKRSQIRRLDRFTLRRESTKVSGASPSSCPPGFQIDAPRHDVRREAPKPSRLCPRYFRHQ
jgi:FkbM family methyltransferase